MAVKYLVSCSNNYLGEEGRRVKKKLVSRVECHDGTILHKL